MKPIILSLLVFYLSFSSIIAQIDNKQLSFNDFKSTLRKDMDHKAIIETFGQPDKDIGSGIYIYIYELPDSTTIIIGCTDHVLYASHCDKESNLLHDFFENSDAIITYKSFEYTYLTKLRPEIPQKNAIINDKIMFTAKSGQLILYNYYTYTAWISDGSYGYFPPEDLIKVDTSYFKFDFSKKDFMLDSKNELFEATKRQGGDINQITSKVINKDTKALFDLFLLRNSYDGAAAEIYPHHFWSLLNLWSDNEIVNFINKLKDKKQFVDYISDNFVTFPIEKPLTYYKLYYPETLKLILTNK